jgi:hypothetical protein
MTVDQAARCLRERRLVFGDPEQITALHLEEDIAHDRQCGNHCDECNGFPVKECRTCDGTKHVDGLTCSACRGCGFILCQWCNGTGTYSAYQFNLKAQAQKTT